MADKQILLTLEQGGKTLSIGTGQVYGLLSVSGLEASDYTIDYQPYAQLDGSRVAGLRIEPRPIAIAAECTAIDAPELLRQTLASFFDPKTAGLLTVALGGVTRSISYRVEGLTFTQKTLFEPLRFTANLSCPSPYFLGEGFSANLAGVTNQTGFPLAFHSVYRPVLSYRTQRQEAPVYNAGDRAVGVRALFQAKRGQVVNPKLENFTTGEMVRVLVTLEKNDELVVDTRPGHKSVTLNGANIIQKIDRQSVFFQFQQGVNVIHYDADSGYANLDVYPRFHAEYLGV